MYTKNIFGIVFKVGKNKWTWNSFRDSYIYIHNIGTESPKWKYKEKHLTWFQIGQDRLSSIEKVMGLDVEYMIQNGLL
jgi:hypothetical protein